MALPIPLPVQHSHEAPHFNPACPSTLHLYDYDLAEAVQLTLAEQLAKCTPYLEAGKRCQDGLGNLTGIQGNASRLEGIQSCSV